MEKPNYQNGYTYGLIGGLISGTHRPADLVPAFIRAIESFKNRKVKGQYSIVNYAKTFMEKASLTPAIWYKNEAAEVVNDLMGALNDFALPFCYFGANVGDGADFGFWVDWEAWNLNHNMDVYRVYNEDKKPIEQFLLKEALGVELYSMNDFRGSIEDQYEFVFDESTNTMYKIYTDEKGDTQLLIVWSV